MSDIQTVAIPHSPLGASGSGRWMKCPGSIQLSNKLGIHWTESGIAAKEGTAAHEILAMCLEQDKEPWEFIGHKVDVEGMIFSVDNEMATALGMCLADVVATVQKAKDKGGELMLFIEESIKHSEHELMYGTTDCCIVLLYVHPVTGEMHCTIWVKDLKYGAGIVVEPTSSQIKYYAVLVIDHLIQQGHIKGFENVDWVHLSIMQPRIPHPDGLIRTITKSGMELGTWFKDELVPAMEETKNPDAILAVGDWCTFCPVKDKCPAMAQAIIDLSKLTHPELMTGKELGEAIQKINAIVKMKDQLEKMAFERAQRGEKVAGFKLVKKRANRQWRDFITVKNEFGEDMKVTLETHLQYIFGKDAYTEPKLKTPPAIEELPGGKAFVTQCAFTPTNIGLTLAPMSDNRVEVKPILNTYLDQLDADADLSSDEV